MPVGAGGWNKNYRWNTSINSWEIEQMFDTMRNVCENDTSYKHSDAGFEAWSFIGHITMIACRILALLGEKKLLKKYSLEGLTEVLSKIHAVQIGNGWRTTEVTKKVLDLVAKLGLELDQEQVLST
ncbi:MAG: hypothetical protein LBU04_06800 [Christensenellaceae bacterium]|nr:hypothetical protein [Christensenellaceae bacterium]